MFYTKPEYSPRKRKLTTSDPNHVSTTNEYWFNARYTIVCRFDSLCENEEEICRGLLVQNVEV